MSQRMTFYTTEKISGKISRTPEGFLLCQDVPIARTGMMLYGPDETPIEAGPDNLVKVHRDEDEVFRPETIASAQGKPVTNDHPDQDVNPENWNDLAIGIVMNVRRGVGAYDDLMIADFMITSKEGIEEIESGKREVSCGYDADYEEIMQGVGRQKNIIINHVALVDQGRCGSRCAVSDHKSTDAKEKTMAKNHSKIVDAIVHALKKAGVTHDKKGKGRDEDLPEAAEEGDVHVHVHGAGEDETSETGRASFTDEDIQEHIDKNEAEHAEMRSRIEALESLVSQLAGGTDDDAEEVKEIEGQLKEEAPVGTGDEEMEQVVKAKDSRYLGESFRDTVGMAEILAPGIKLPTYDSAASPAQTFKKICHFRRNALDVAYAAPRTQAVINELLGGKPLDTKQMTCDAVRQLFRSAASVVRGMNNAGRTEDDKSVKVSVGSLAEMNKRNSEYWAKH